VLVVQILTNLGIAVWKRFWNCCA